MALGLTQSVKLKRVTIEGHENAFIDSAVIFIHVHLHTDRGDDNVKRLADAEEQR